MKLAARSQALYLVAFAAFNFGITNGIQQPALAETAGAAVSQPKQGKKPDKYTIKAAVSSNQRLTLKYGNHFLLLDQAGNAPEDNPFGFGLYRDDTRYLSTWEVRLNDQPMVLSYSNTQDGYAGRFLYTNPANSTMGEQRVLIERDVLINSRLREHIRVTNFDSADRSINLSIAYASDFADMFEVRGQARTERGELQPPSVSSSGKEVILSYTGLDHQTMKTYIAFSRAATTLDGTKACFQLSLHPHQTWDLDVATTTNHNEPSPAPLAEDTSFAQEKRAADDAYAAWRKAGATIVSDNENLNKWIERSFRDIYILRQSTPKGNCIAAGIPWFAVAFGRDQEITSLETLPFIPDLTRDVLGTLAAYQGTKVDATTEEEPGRIMHELRLGEMARMHEIPFRPYYGTVDATPLYLVLLGRYVNTTDDLEFARTHWQNVEAILAYLDEHIKATGYLSYGGKPGAALSNQGWKDSYDSVMYHDGKLAVAPIAICEAQGYVYAAWRAAAQLAQRLGKNDEAKALTAKADAFQSKFQKDFWNEKLGFVALALDGKGAQCEVVASNPGHLLFTGILTPSQESAVADRLVKSDMFSGWGIRTLSSQEAAYNPLSYHDGSVWPHDNAIIAGGLGNSRLMHSDYADKVLSALFLAAQQQSDWRLPELFCGFPRDYSEKPVSYPVSCSPQAWAAGSVFLALQGALGLSIDAQHGTVSSDHPCLPDGVSRLEIRNLRVGKNGFKLIFNRNHNGVECDAKPESE
jgi:glycogen debranching enzyme